MTPTPERFNSLRTGTDGRGIHDVGGLDFGPVDREEHELTYYEKRVDALLMLLARHRVFRVDALRRAIEGYAEQEYDGTAYYDRWIKAIRILLLEQNVLSPEELDARIEEVRARLQREGRVVDPRTVA